MKIKNKNKFLVFIVFYILLSLPLYAEPISTSPHQKATVESGIITGTLLKEGREPLAGYEVRLEILQQHNLILSIPKPTDEKGQFQFKNIFQSPDFMYAVSTEYEDMTYRTDFVSLKKGEQVRKLNLIVGKSAKQGPQLPPTMPEEMTKPHAKSMLQKIGTDEYKLIAVILSLVAVGYALYRRKK